MLDKIRTTLHQAIESPRGDAMTAVRVPKMFARKLNRYLGSPLCSAGDLEKRRAAVAKLASLHGASQAKLERSAAPVLVYFEKDRNQRMKDRVEELLQSRGIAFRSLDVAGDEAAMAFVTREAKCKEDDLPIVYVAGTPVGGYNDLVDWDVSGKLKTAVFGS
jgi:glutaredoxin